MKIVLDSNVLLVAVAKRSAYRRIWRAFVEGEYQIVISDQIVFEYIEILQRRASFGTWESVRDIFIESPDVIFQQIHYSWNLIIRTQTITNLSTPR